MNLKSSGYKKRERWFTLIGSILAILLVYYLVSLVVSIRQQAQVVFESPKPATAGFEGFNLEKYNMIIRAIFGEQAGDRLIQRNDKPLG